MKREFDPRKLDVRAFAEAGETLTGADPISSLRRLKEEVVDAADAGAVDWTAVGQTRLRASGPSDPWMHLLADAMVPLVCQRCLSPVAVPLSVDRWFRFVVDEATAAAEDESSQEDVLVESRAFDLLEHLEDELLMEIPATPLHEICPQPVRMSVADADFEVAEDARVRPFEILEVLRSRKGDEKE